MRILPYLHEYLKTNNFLLWLGLFLAAAAAAGRFRVRISPKAVFFAALALGLLVRVGWLAFSNHETRTEWTDGHLLESDAANIHAIEITRGIWFCDSHGNPTGRRPIGYPVFLGALYKLFGPRIEVAWIAHLALFAAAAALIFLIGRSVFSEEAGALAALFFALYPTSIYTVKLTTDEHLFLPLWYLGLYLLLRDLGGKPLRASFVWYGVLFGFAAMTRTHVIFMPLVVGLALRLKGLSWRKVFVSIAVTAAVMQAVNLPWVARNRSVWGVPVVYTATAGFVWSQVNSSADAEGGGHIPRAGEPDYSGELERAFASGNEGLGHREASRRMTRWILRHPIEFAVRGIERVLVFMNWNRKGGAWAAWFQFYEGSYRPPAPPQAVKDFLEELVYVSYYIVFHCFVFALALLATPAYRQAGVARPIASPAGPPPRGRAGAVVILSCFFFWLLEHMVIYPDRKYRYPLEGLMMVFAAFFLTRVTAFAAGSRKTRARPRAAEAATPLSRHASRRRGHRRRGQAA